MSQTDVRAGIPKTEKVVVITIDYLRFILFANTPIRRYARPATAGVFPSRSDRQRIK